MRKAKVIVAHNMSEETYKKLTDGVKNKFGSDISFERKVDDNIIGGFILKFNGVVYDNSLKTQITRLKQHISN